MNSGEICYAPTSSRTVVITVACVLVNLEGWRATYWAEWAASCGVLTVALSGLTDSTDEAQRAADCYTLATCHCRAVVLQADGVNVDSGANYFFLVSAHAGHRAMSSYPSSTADT